MNGTKRIYWEDNLKFLGILCVILGHHCISGEIGYFVSSFLIFSFHIPLFFFANGLNKKKIFNEIEWLKKKFFSLIIPYFVASCFAIIFDSWLRKEVFVNILHITDITYGARGIFTSSFILFTGFGQLWFIPCMVTTDIFWIISRKYLLNLNILLRYLILVSLGCLGVAINVLFEQKQFINFCQIPNSCIALLFVYIGYDYMHNNDKRMRIIIFTLWMVIFPIMVYQHKFINMGGYSYPLYPLCIIEAVGIIWILTWIFKKTNYIYGISYWGKNSMIIYLIHAIENNFFPWIDIKALLYNNIINNRVCIDIITFIIRVIGILLVSQLVIKIKEYLCGQFYNISKNKRSI